MLKNLRLSQQALILLLVPLLFEVIFVSALTWQMRQFDSLLNEVNASRDFGATLDNLVESMYESAKLIDMIHSYTKHEVSSEMIPDNAPEVLRQKAKRIGDLLVRLDKDAPTPEMKTRVHELARPIIKIHRVMSAAVEIYDEGGLLTLYAVLKGKKDQIGDKFAYTRDDLFRSLSDLLRAKEESQADYDNKISQQEQSFHRIIGIVIIGGVFHVGLAVFLWLNFSRDTAYSFRILMDNTRRLAAGMPLNPPLAGDGEIAHLDRVFNDMAQALEAARRKERAIIENAIDVICSMDEKNKFTAMSPACEALFGYAIDGMVGSKFEDLIYTEDRERALDMVRRIREEEHRGQFETRVKTKSGAVVDVLWAIQWSAVEQSMFCVAHDITERKEIERMKQEFVAMVSHDLRTPLTSIQGFLTLLATGMYGELSDTGSQNLAIADANISRLIALINDLLDIEKMESGKMQMDLDPASLSDIFGRSVGAVSGFAQQQRVKLIAEKTDLEVFADSDRIVQVLVNLISNAIKFSPKEGTVSLEARDLADCVEIRVTDQGRGIPADYIDSIFERFQQVEKSDAKVKGGSGLGLAICKAIVEGHKGKIGVESQEGKGSSFWFQIPKQPEAVKTIA